MNAQKAYNQLKNVPEDQFIEHYFGKDGKCCVIGHLIRINIQPDEINNNTCSDSLIGFYPNPVEDKNKRQKVKQISFFAREEVAEFLRVKYGLNFTTLAEINNNSSVNGFTQTSIKDRVLACLKEMIEWEKIHNS